MTSPPHAHHKLPELDMSVLAHRHDGALLCLIRDLPHRLRMTARERQSLALEHPIDRQTAVLMSRHHEVRVVDEADAGDRGAVSQTLSHHLAGATSQPLPSPTRRCTCRGRRWPCPE